jgi:hypothetical protein
LPKAYDFIQAKEHQFVQNMSQDSEHEKLTEGKCLAATTTSTGLPEVSKEECTYALPV